MTRSSKFELRLYLQIAIALAVVLLAGRAAWAQVNATLELDVSKPGPAIPGNLSGIMDHSSADRFNSIRFKGEYSLVQPRACRRIERSGCGENFQWVTSPTRE